MATYGGYQLKYWKDLKLCLSHTEIFSKRRKIYSWCVKDLSCYAF